jgi:hypothetical protein
VIDAGVTYATEQALRLTRLRGRRLWFDGADLGAEAEPNKALGRLYYGRIYIRGIDDGGPPIASPPPGERAWPPLAERLREAVDWVGREPGWRLSGRSGSGLILTRDGLSLSVSAADLEEDPATLSLGDLATLRLAGPFQNLSPGFSLSVGSAPLTLGSEDRLLRWYWNVSAQGAPTLVRAIAGEMEEGEIPFHLKALSDPAHYGRADAAVLYVRRRDHDRTRRRLAALLPSLAALLGHATPVFAKRMAPGVGFAENPAEQRSFGELWCDHLADAVASSLAEPYPDEAARRQAIYERLSAAGLNLRQPWLIGHNDDDYGLLQPIPAPPSRRRPPQPAEALGAITANLAQSALWCDGRATWLHQPMPWMKSTRRTLGVDVYSGLAGVAWFLGEAGAALGDREALKACRGAMEQAFHLAETRPDGEGGGLYTGLTGLCLVAGRLSVLLGERSWSERSSALLERLLAPDTKPQDTDEDDLLHGLAGVAAGLAVLQGAGGRSDLTPALGRVSAALAASLNGEDPLQHAGSGRRRRRLFGYSHGAMGVSLGLGAAGRALSDARLIDLGQRLAEAEARRYVPGARNWPDLRSRTRSYQSAWCHGAPGILLGRHVWRDRLGAGLQHRPQMKAGARDQLRGDAQACLASERPDWTLCHGVLGIAEILDLTAQDDAERALAEEVVLTGVRRYGRAGWPMMVGSDNPTLMCGAAGVGMALLRRIEPGAPSPLLLAFNGDC